MDKPPDGPCQVIITAPDRGWLRSFVRLLIDHHLAAAGHVDIMETTYRWAGQVHQSDEARAILHTRLACVEEITAATRESHPYEVACVAATAIIAGDPEYLAWVMDMTNASSELTSSRDL